MPTKNASAAGPDRGDHRSREHAVQQVGRRVGVRAVRHKPPDQHLAHEDGGEGRGPDQDEDACRIAGGRLALCREAGERKEAWNRQQHADEEEQCAAYQREAWSTRIAICSAVSILSSGWKRSPMVIRSGPTMRLAAAMSVR